ncbi:hypothetical protein [Draconibacterium halophilum]|uniref:Uncharacterized protein n=1 Tax=Draconibacterium halophilum TaxID=2706887 RepID=A0A6C0REL0_9BACT|nr:hypothetical protein [Draconibacterium halophilum]QIA08376.1 hypothetical protein G0Q07_11930 [Draconibacterium halophilum]
MKNTAKHIGSFLLFLAGAIILTHAFVPHHLHNGEAIIESSECQHFHHHESGMQTASCTHSHSENEASDCVLHNLLVIPGKQIRTDQPLVATSLPYTFCSLLISGVITPNLKVNASDWHHHIEGTIPLPSNIFTSTLGLRAPPLA